MIYPQEWSARPQQVSDYPIDPTAIPLVQISLSGRDLRKTKDSEKRGHRDFRHGSQERS
jgi:hypothetical protein